MQIKNFLLVVVVLCCSFQTMAFDLQKLLKQTKCEIDTDAEAMIVSDVGESRFIEAVGGGLVVEFKREITFKIFKETGVHFAEKEIVLYRDDNDIEELDEFEASVHTLLENGNISSVKVGKKDLYEEELTKECTVLKYALPGAKKGSVVTVKYTTISPFYFNFQDWDFQASIPVKKSFYRARMIPFYSYIFILTGADHFDHFQHREDRYNSRRMFGVEFVDMIYEFGMNNIPAFKDVEYISAPEDYKIKIDFQLAELHRPDGFVKRYMETWDKMIVDLLKNINFGKYLKNAKSEARKILKEIDMSALSDVAKAEYIVRYVKDNYVWDGYYGKYASQTMREFKRKKEGNVGDVNLFLVAMLAEAGIETHPLIISTRGHGKVFSKYPFAHFFNYVTAYSKIEGKTFQFDATEPLLIFDELPIRCYNDKGLLIKKGPAQWCKLYPPKNSIVDVKFIGEFNTGYDSLNIKIKHKTKGIDALLYRSEYKDSESEYLDWVKPSGFDMKSLEIENLDSVNKPFKSEITGAKQLFVMDSTIMIHPFFGTTISDNPFKFKERNYPIDMIYPKSRQYYFELKIPKGITVDYLPAPKTIDLEGLAFSYFITHRNNSIIISTSYTMERGVYAQKEYKKMKKFYNDVINQLNEKVILKMENN